jgi:hypothetical protein
MHWVKKYLHPSFNNENFNVLTYSNPLKNNIYLSNVVSQTMSQYSYLSFDESSWIQDMHKLWVVKCSLIYAPYFFK